MGVSNTYVYVDYFKIWQALSMNKLYLLIFMVRPEFQQSKTEIKEVFK